MAVKRLNSIKEFTELGSGYKIAMRDLSIRGAGDLLGREQAGFVDAVGLDLYTRMLNDEIRRLQGMEVEEKTVQNSGAILPISTHIDDKYVDDESIKIEIHKLINSIQAKADFDNVKFELEDRFGKIPKDIEIYMLEKCVENIVNKLKIKINTLTNKIVIVIPKEISDQINGEKLFFEAYNINHKFELSYQNKCITIKLLTSLLKNNYMYYIYNLLDVINNQINDV